MSTYQEYVSLDTAAKGLGISVAAVRKRLQRGSLSGKKNSSGRWMVLVTEDMKEPRTITTTSPMTLDNSPTTQEDSHKTEPTSAIAALERENERLNSTVQKLLEQQEKLINQTENEQVLRREAQQQITHLTNQLADLSTKNVALLEDKSGTERQFSTLKKSVVQLLNYLKR